MSKPNRDANRMARRGRERLLERYTWAKIAAAARKAYLPSRAEAPPGKKVTELA